MLFGKLQIITSTITPYANSVSCIVTNSNFFEAGMDYKEDKLNRIKKYFPNAYKVYQKMLEDALD